MPVLRPAFIGLLLLGPVLLLGGCASTPSTEVTRFHRLDAAQGQPLLVEPADPALNGLEFQSYAQMVGAELGAYGFSAAKSGAAPAFTAKIDYGAGPAPGHYARSEPRSSLGVGVGSWGGGVGMSTGVSIPIGKPREIPAPSLYFLQLRIYRAGDPVPVFEGRAETVAEGRGLPALMPVLVRAMFRDFPGRSGKTVTIKDEAPPAR